MRVIPEHSGVTIEGHQGTYRGYVHRDDGSVIMSTRSHRDKLDCEVSISEAYEIMKREPFIRDYELVTRPRKWYFLWMW